MEIEYLGCVLSRDGIKPQKGKVQAFFALIPPRCRKELRRFIGMVQYYGDILDTMKQNAGPTVQFDWGVRTQQSHKGI